MSYVLKDRDTGHFFCEPHGEDMKEWSSNPRLAYRFVTLERAQGGKEVWHQIHCKELNVVPYEIALIHHAERLGSDH